MRKGVFKILALMLVFSIFSVLLIGCSASKEQYSDSQIMFHRAMKNITKNLCWHINRAAEPISGQ